MCQAIKEGLDERAVEKENTAKETVEEGEEQPVERKRQRRSSAKKEHVEEAPVEVAETEEN